MEYPPNALAAERALAGCSLFAGVPQDLLENELPKIAVHRYRAGQMLSSSGRPLASLGVVASGRVRVFRSLADGRTMTVRICGIGEIFGEEVWLTQPPPGSHAQAMEACTVALVGGDVLRRLAGADPGLSVRVIELLVSRENRLAARLQDAALRSVPARIALALVESGLTREGSGGAVRLTHEQLADLVGTSRSSVTKVIAAFVSRDLVIARRGRVVILDPARLQSLGEDDQLTVSTGGSRS